MVGCAANSLGAINATATTTIERALAKRAVRDRRFAATSRPGVASHMARPIQDPSANLPEKKQRTHKFDLAAGEFLRVWLRRHVLAVLFSKFLRSHLEWVLRPCIAARAACSCPLVPQYSDGNSYQSCQMGH